MKRYTRLARWTVEALWHSCQVTICTVPLSLWTELRMAGTAAFLPRVQRMGENFASTFPTSIPTGSHAFVLKLNLNGQLQYARLIDGPPTSANDIAVSGTSEALVSGQVIGGPGTLIFPTTQNAVAPKISISDQFIGFLVKLDGTRRETLVSLAGFGSGLVAFDAMGNIYATGQVGWYTDILPTPGVVVNKSRCPG